MKTTELSEEAYYHWLYQIPGVGKITMRKILEVTTPRQLFEEGTGLLENIISERLAGEIERKRQSINIQREWEELQNAGICLLYYGSEGYPSKLSVIPDPPLLLYKKGEKHLWNLPTLAVVGARECSAYGKLMAKEMGMELAKNGILTVSGMARGVDGICQWNTLEAGGRSIGVLGCGVQVCYPEENYPLYERLQRQGCLLSEYSPYTKPAPGLFPPRNRIISGLADILVVIEARRKSGTLITVDMALEQGKEVYCVPGRTTDDLSKGCNQLIKMGAGMILSVSEFAEEICDHYKTIYQKREGEEEYVPDKLERIILNALDVTPLFIEEILENIKREKKDMTLQQLLDILLQLQIKEKICQEGQYYYKK
ncbi:MAG: DNA-processing protein DprA [Lachnospiraceae bacterium]|nr:DNA-processing protein DprA [Lachnospiraceae bacterium]